MKTLNYESWKKYFEVGSVSFAFWHHSQIKIDEVKNKKEVASD